MTDEQLIKKCLQSDARAQKMLFDKYGKKFMGVCFRYAINEDEAKDILQEGFIKIFENLNKYSGKGSFEGWMRKIIINTALDNIRKNKKINFHLDVNEIEYKLISNDYIEENLAAEDLLKILNNIPFGYKTVFNMYAIEGYSHKEIANKLGITESTSKSQYSRAKAVLRNTINKLKIG